MGTWHHVLQIEWNKIKLKKLACTAFHFTNNITGMNWLLHGNFYMNFPAFSLKHFKPEAGSRWKPAQSPLLFFSWTLVTAVLLWQWGTEDSCLTSTTDHAETFSLVSDRQAGHSPVPFRKFLTRTLTLPKKSQKRELWPMLLKQSKPCWFSPAYCWKVLYNL